MSCPTDFIASVTTASSPMPTGPATLHWPAGSSSYPTQLRRAGRAITPKMVATTKTGMLALAAAGSSSRPSNPAASPASGPSPRSRSIAHEQHPVVAAPIAPPVRRRYPAGNSHTLPMAPSASTSAAKTQILQHAGTGPSHRSGRFWRLKARHPGFVLRQPVVYLDPRHLGADEHVELRTHPRIVIEESSWNADRSQVGRLARHGRATHPTKIAEAPGRGLETLDRIFTCHKAELVCIDVHVACDVCTAQLTAVTTMTVGQGSSLVDLEFDPATEAASFDHRKSLSRISLSVPTHITKVGFSPK